MVEVEIGSGVIVGVAVEEGAGDGVSEAVGTGAGWQPQRTADTRMITRQAWSRRIMASSWENYTPRRA